jgi:hypothetical protein
MSAFGNDNTAARAGSALQDASGAGASRCASRPASYRTSTRAPNRSLLGASPSFLALGTIFASDFLEAKSSLDLSR